MAKTIIDLGREKKLQYPGEFDDLTDADLGKQIKEANPGQYDKYKDLNPLVNDRTIGQRITEGAGKVLDVFNRITSVASNPIAKGLAGAAKNLPVSEEKKLELEALQKQKEPTFGSDVFETLFPFLKPRDLYSDSPEDNSGDVPANPNSPAFKAKMAGLGENNGGSFLDLLTEGPKVVAKTGIDIATDPLSYLEFGGATKLGRVAETVNEARSAGVGIKLDSKLAREGAEVLGQSKPSAQTIKSLKKLGAPGKTFEEQVAQGQRSLASVGLPFSESKRIPIGTGKLASKVVAPFSAAQKSAIGSKITNGLRELFSTKSGDPEFDALLTRAKDLAYHRAGLVVKQGVNFNKELNQLAKDSGIERDVLNKHITSLVEEATTRTKAQNIRIYGKDVFDKLYDDYNNKFIDAKINLVNAHKTGDVDGIEKYAQQVVDYNSEMNRLSGKYSPPPAINPAVDKVVKEIRARNANQLLREHTSGLKAIPLLADREYIAHVMTPEARQALSDYLKRQGLLPPKLSQRELSDYLANTIRRQFVEVRPEVVKAWKQAGIINGHDQRAILSKTGEGVGRLDKLLDKGVITDEQFTDAVHTLGVSEVNSLPKEAKIRLFGKDIKEVFHTDPVYSTSIRGIRGEVARTYSEFFNDLIHRGIAIPDAAAPSHYVGVRLPELEGHKVSPEIARVLNKVHTFNTNSSELKEALNLYDKYHQILKVWTLAPFPAYHTMNAVGNFWNNFLAGVKNPLVYIQAEAARLGRKVRFKDAYGHAWDEKRVVNEAEKLGVIGKGLYGGDPAKTLKEEIEGSKFLAFDSRNKALQAGIKFGKRVEDNARLAHFIDRLKKGDTPERAALSVKKFLFDYSDLTDFERNVLNRTFFFYAWTRKNLPLQLHGLVTKPGVYKIPVDLKHEVEKETPQAPEKYLQEYFKDNYPIRLRYDKKTKNYQYFMLGRWIPAADLLKLSHLHEIALNSLYPMEKELLQQLWPKQGGLDFFTQEPIEKIPGEKGDFYFGPKKLSLSKRTIHGMKAIRMLNTIDQLSKPEEDLFTKSIGLLTGRVQKFDPVKGFLNNKYRVDKDVSALKAAMIQAGKRGDSTEVKRIVDLLKAKYEEY